MTTLPIFVKEGYLPIVTSGTVVTKGAVLAKKPKIHDEVVSVAAKLSVAPSTIGTFLLKQPGDRVQTNEAVASKKSLFRKQTVESPVDGTLLRVDEENGTVVIRKDLPSDGENDTQAYVTLLSPVDGTVVSIDPKKIVLEVSSTVLMGTKGIGREAQAPLVVMPYETMQGGFLTSGLSDKIIAGGTFPKDVLMKAIALGVSGILGTNILEEDLRYLIGKSSHTPILEVSDGVMQQLRSLNGHTVFIDGTSGVVIPL